MRKLVVASIAAFAALTVSAHIAANVANAKTDATATPKVAREPAVEPHYIRAIQTVGGVKSEVRYTQSDGSGQSFVAIWPSKKACDEARTKTPNVVGLLASYTAAVKQRKGTVVITCAKWTQPVTPNDDDEPKLPPGHPPIDKSQDKPPGVDI